MIPVSYTHLDVYKRQGDGRDDDVRGTKRPSQSSPPARRKFLRGAGKLFTKSAPCWGAVRRQRGNAPYHLSLIHIFVKELGIENEDNYMKDYTKQYAFKKVSYRFKSTSSGACSLMIKPVEAE